MPLTQRISKKPPVCILHCTLLLLHFSLVAITFPFDIYTLRLHTTYKQANTMTLSQATYPTLSLFHVLHPRHGWFFALSYEISFIWHFRASSQHYAHKSIRDLDIFCEPKFKPNPSLTLFNFHAQFYLHSRLSSVLFSTSVLYCLLSVLLFLLTYIFSFTILTPSIFTSILHQKQQKTQLNNNPILLYFKKKTNKEKKERHRPDIKQIKKERHTNHF